MKIHVLLIIILLATGCATMIHGTHQDVPVQSDPAGARVRVDCGDAPLEPGVTPLVISLPRAEEHCSLTLTKDGFVERTIVFERQLSRATSGNQVGGVVTGTFVGLIGLITGAFVSEGAADAGATVGFDAGSAAGSAAGHGIDKRTGAAYKHAPERIMVRLEPQS
jgi:hypothetical protein